ncbi:MAG TPA: polysaccharide deacetylase family protein [Gemmatimonadaceae bacterium]|nr:polysaccharide deacetylase family protein [Gemmatimonadaceae bacterium]
MSGFDASFTCDLEPDCPPYLRGFRGVEEGLPKLLAALASLGIRGTFFTTGEVARRYPDAVRSVLAGGHELACHGMSHTAFTDMTRDQAWAEIEESAAILRQFAPVTSFRAPYLKFPDALLGMLEQARFELDSSQAKYKKAYYDSRRAGVRTSLKRIPASLTSSALRIPRLLREAYVRSVSSPVVLFVHPWEFVDLRKEKLRYDCRFRTGDVAIECVSDVLRGMLKRGARFQTMAELGRAS